MLVIRWSLIGALVAGVLTFAGFLILCHGEMFTHDTGEVQGWAWFGAEMASAGASVVGLVLGGIYGIVRVRKAPLLKVIGSSLVGAFIAGIVTAGIFICMRRVNHSIAADPHLQEGEVVPLSVYGAMFGFVLGSVYGIIRAGFRIPTPSATDQKA
jgi:hypothetical protein